jgi:hypothetical protein
MLLNSNLVVVEYSNLNLDGSMGCLFSRTFVYAHPSGDMHQRSTQTKAFNADVLSKFEQSIADIWILHHLV